MSCKGILQLWQGLVLVLLLGGCAATAQPELLADPGPRPAGATLAAAGDLAIAYSGYRAGQHPDRGNGAVDPSRAQVQQDLELLVAQGFRLLRLYDTGSHSQTTLQLIDELKLPLKVLLGAWLNAELSNHAGCPWLDEPIPDTTLAANRLANQQALARVVALANRYPMIVVAVNVGNEALVDWTDHLVPLERVIEQVRYVRARITQPVTVAENWAWWVNHGATLAAELDFIGVHSYPLWEGHDISTGIRWTDANIKAVAAALPGHPLAILEAGWASQAVEFGERASQALQAQHVDELQHWADHTNTTVFLFEAFDEPWKGDPNNPDGAEKHWGLFDVQRQPKLAMQPMPGPLFNPAAVALAINVGGPALTTADGIRWQADHSSLGGAAGTLDRVRGAQDPRVYQSYREGALFLRQPLANGRYDLTLHFVEPTNEPVGSRVFHVLAQGDQVITNLDVRLARDGKAQSALTRSAISLEVTDGTFELQLDPITGTPLLAGLVLRRQQPDPRQWTLAWADEFNGDGAPDPKRWTSEEWPARKVNDEDQAYTSRPRNVRVQDGHLLLEAHRENFADARYTSGRIQSSGKGDILYGRVDVRARLPAGRGTWPAIWMLPSDPFRYATTCQDDAGWQGSSDCDAWPNSGEIDIMEHVGYDPHRVHGTVHTAAYYWAEWNQRKGSVEVPRTDTEFHIYSLVWSPERIDVHVDGSPYFTYLNDGTGWQSWPFDHPFHVVMNLAVGGFWGRAGGPIDDSQYPVKMEVDWVRVFQLHGEQ